MAALNITDLGLNIDQLYRDTTADLLALEIHLAQRATSQTKRGQLYTAAQERVRAILADRGVRTQFTRHADLPTQLARHTENHVFTVFDRDGQPNYTTSLTTEGARALRDQLIAADLG